MSLCILETNDAELRCARGSFIALRSPGYALARGSELLLGTDAQRQARLHPRQSFNRFWLNLNQDALSVTEANIRHHADLVYAHLLAIHEQSGRPEQIVFAVPGSYNHEQLSMLLGIAQACPFKPAGLVDSAVAAVASVAAQGRYQHLDLQLHRAVISSVDVTESVSRQGVESIDDAGLAAVETLCADTIADLYIRQSRFDPHHHAVTEQALYDQLPACLRALRTQPEVQLEIRYEGARHLAKVPRESVLAALKPLYARIRSRLDPARTLLLSDRSAALPGFMHAAEEAFVLDAEAPFAGCREHLDRIVGSGASLGFVTRLPAAPQPTIQSDADAESPTVLRLSETEPVTHLLQGHRAWPLGSHPLHLSASAPPHGQGGSEARCSVSLQQGRATLRVHPGAAVYVNGETVAAERTLAPGDMIRFAETGAGFVAISAADTDGT